MKHNDPETNTLKPQKRSYVPGKISRLFDYWNIRNILFAGFLKILQFVRLLGGKANTHAWRILTGTFLRKEYSKFGLAAFHLDYAGQTEKKPQNEEEASELLVSRLYEYLTTRPEVHWALEYRFFSFARKKTQLCDLVKAEVAPNGDILRLTPYFMGGTKQRPPYSRRHMALVLQGVIRSYNLHRHSTAEFRQQAVRKSVERWVAREGGFHFMKRWKLHLLVERVMTAVYVFTEVQKKDADAPWKKRLHFPDRKYRHPGWGMMCILARFPQDFSEVDLHFNFHHVVTDGVPMQNMLNALKEAWGVRSPLVLPPMHFPVAHPETVFCGDGIFRARFYADFTVLLKVRKYLNRKYMQEMGGSASFAGLLMWGLAEHDFFRKQKMLLPVDAGAIGSGERDLGLLFIRPAVFKNVHRKLNSFLAFQKEMNRQLEATRNGQSESGEFLTLITMLHPWAMRFGNVLAKYSVQEIVGTMGISIIRDADFFTAPLTDLQTKGFLALGSVMLPTENGKKAGAVCVCAERRQIRCYIEAVKNMLGNFPATLDLHENWEKEI